MIDPALTPGVPSQPQASGVRASSGAAKAGAFDGSAAIRGARFQALLEELDLRAKAMAKSAQEPLSAEELPAAVESARTSMEDALELSRNLLEACRQNAAQTSDSKPLRP